MHVSSTTTLSHDLPQSHEILMTGTSAKSCDGGSTMSPDSSKNLKQFLEITLAQDWLAAVTEGAARVHAQMMLPEIISRYLRTSETVQNHQYYMNLFSLSKGQVREALQCLEDTGILTRLTFCNLMTADDSTFDILTLSNEFRDLIQTQRSKRSQDVSQGEIQ